MTTERQRRWYRKYPAALVTSIKIVDADYNPQNRFGLDYWYQTGLNDGASPLYKTWSARDMLLGWRGDGFYEEEIDSYLRGFDEGRKSLNSA